jgi:DNA helicase HerA-like ATPase
MKVGVTGAGDELLVPLELLRRHAVVLGSSGSGKTVLGKVIAEESIAKRLPVIAIDLQGDLAALALSADPRAVKFIERVEPKIWTPASKVGIPISAARIDVNELFGLWEGGPAPTARPGSRSSPSFTSMIPSAISSSPHSARPCMHGC